MPLAVSTDESNFNFEGGATLPLAIEIANLLWSLLHQLSRSKSFLHYYFILRNSQVGVANSRSINRIWRLSHLLKHQSSFPILDEASRVTAAVARGLLSFRAHAGLLCSRAFSSRPPAQQTASSAAPTSSFRSATSKLLQSPHPLPAAPPIPKWNQPSKLDCIHAIEHGGNKNKRSPWLHFFLLWYIFILWLMKVFTNPH